MPIVLTVVILVYTCSWVWRHSQRLRHERLVKDPAYFHIWGIRG